jgi:hypothetical protein
MPPSVSDPLPAHAVPGYGPDEALRLAHQVSDEPRLGPEEGLHVGNGKRFRWLCWPPGARNALGRGACDHQADRGGRGGADGRVRRGTPGQRIVASASRVARNTELHEAPVPQVTV